MSKTDPYETPEWLLDAWKAGVATSLGKGRERLIYRIEQQLAKNSSKNPDSWDYWNTAALLAQLGWMEVTNARKSESETNRTEESDSTAGE